MHWSCISSTTAFIPARSRDWEALVKKPDGLPEAKHWKAYGYLKSVPVHPWGNSYQYLCPGRHGAYDLWSFGADGKPGGEGYNKDIGNWE